jgi:hypothetical protein
MATVTVAHLLERFQQAARLYLDETAGGSREQYYTTPVQEDVRLGRAIKALEAVAMPSKTHAHQTNGPVGPQQHKNTRIVLELVQSLQHWRDMQLASVRALEKSMDASYASSAKKSKQISDAHSVNPVCERLLCAIEEVFLSGVLAVLSGGNCLPSAKFEPLLGGSSDGAGTVAQLLEQAWQFWTDPLKGAMLKLFEAPRARCNALWCSTVGLLTISVLGRVTDRLLVGLEQSQAMEVLDGLREVRLGIETQARSDASRKFLATLVPFTMKIHTKDAKLRNVALRTLAAVLQRMSATSVLHEKASEQQCLLLWTEVLEESCGAGSAIARATGKGKYKASRPYLWPVLTAALCCAPHQVFRNGVSGHLEKLIATAQDPGLTNMALECIHDTVRMFLWHQRASIASSQSATSHVFEVLQDTATKLIFSTSPPRIDEDGVRVLSDTILLVLEYNFDFAMLNMVVALMKSARKDMETALQSIPPAKLEQMTGQPRITWKFEVALQTLQRSFKQHLTQDDWASRIDLYRGTLSDCFAFLLRACDVSIEPALKWSARDTHVYELVLELLPHACPTDILFHELALMLVRAEQWHPSAPVRAAAKTTLLCTLMPDFKFAGAEDIPTFSQVCDGLDAVISFLLKSEQTHALPGDITVLLPSARAGAAAMFKDISAIFCNEYRDLQHLRKFQSFCDATVNIEAFALNLLCSPDVGCYADAVGILDDARTMRDEEGFAVADSFDIALAKILPQNPGNVASAAVTRAHFDDLLRFGGDDMLFVPSQDGENKFGPCHLGGWQFQAVWQSLLSEIARDLGLKSKREQTQEVIKVSLSIATKQRACVEDEAITLGKGVHMKVTTKASSMALRQRFHVFVWWKNLISFQLSAISVLPTEEARQLMVHLVHMLSNETLYDAQQLMKQGNFNVHCSFLDSEGWAGDNSVVVDVIVSSLGGIPCNAVLMETLLTLLWDHEVEVLPEDGGFGERYDDDPSDPTKSDGSWTSKLLGTASKLKIQAMRRKLVQLALTSILAHQAQRATIEVWCSDGVQSRVLSFIKKMRDRLEGRPRRYKDIMPSNSKGYQGYHHDIPEIPAILTIRELYCNLMHDFAAIVNVSDKALDSKANSVLSPSIRASLFETCLEWCVGKPERARSLGGGANRMSMATLVWRNSNEVATNLPPTLLYSYPQRQSRLHFATCAAMSVLVQGPPFEASALSPGPDGFVWAWVDALLLSMPTMDPDAMGNGVLREQRIANGAVQSILKSNPVESVIPVLIDRIHNHDGLVAQGYLTALVSALQSLALRQVTDDENLQPLLSALIFLGLFLSGDRAVCMRRTGFELLDTVLGMHHVADDERQDIQSLCSPAFVSCTELDSAQAKASELVYTAFGNKLACSMLDECCRRVKPLFGDETGGWKIRQMLELLSPWTQSFGAFERLRILSTTIIAKEEPRCLALWCRHMRAMKTDGSLPATVGLLTKLTSESLNRAVVLRTCKLAMTAARTAGASIALETCMNPWDPDTVPRDALKRDAAVVLGSSVLPVSSSVIHSLLGRIMHAGARSIFSSSALVRNHARSLLINACRSMGRVGHVGELEAMFRIIQDGDTAQNSKLALDGVVAAVVGVREDATSILGTLAAELIGAAAAECYALPDDGSATIQEMEDIRFSFLFYEVLAPRVEYQTQTLSKLAQALDHSLGVAVSKTLHKQVVDYDGTPHSLLVNSIINALSMTIETMPAEKMVLFPQIVWAAVSLMRPGTGRLFPTSMKLVLKIFEKLNPIENSLMRDVVEACRPTDEGWQSFHGVLPMIMDGVGHEESDAAAVALVQAMLGAPREMDYFVDARPEREQLVVFASVVMASVNRALYAKESGSGCTSVDDMKGSIETIVSMCDSVGALVLKDFFHSFLVDKDNRPEEIVGESSYDNFFACFSRGIIDLFGESKDLLTLFLRTQLRTLHGSVTYYLPCCVMILKHVLGGGAPLVVSFLKCPGSKILDDISVALTDKLDGSMWEEILPMLHTIASARDSPDAPAASGNSSVLGVSSSVGGNVGPSPIEMSTPLKRDDVNHKWSTDGAENTPLRAAERTKPSPSLGGRPTSPFQQFVRG